MISTRVYGLDLLRTLAISLVFIHNFWFVDKQLIFSIITSIGWVGVDLFFMLSGYLIGYQIFRYIMEEKFSIVTFIIRRLFRILPNYLVIVILYIIFKDLRDAPVLPSIAKILTFTTNIGLKTGTGLSYTWSLCIEEQFYLTLPFIIIMLNHKKLIYLNWSIILLILTGGMVLRGYLWLAYIDKITNPIFLNGSKFSSYQTNIYFLTLCRLDELTIGVIIAALKVFYKEYWEKITAHGNILLLNATFFGLASFYLFLNYHYTFLTTVVGFPLLGITFGFLTLSVLSENSLLNKVRIPGVSKIATLSFAIYLVEKPLNHLTLSLLKSHSSITLSNPLTFLFATLISFTGALILYNFVELPCIKIRDKIYNKPNYNN